MCVAEATVGGFANGSQGLPVLGIDAPADPEVSGVGDHQLGAQSPVLLEVLLEAGRAVVAAQLGVNPSGDDLGPERTGCHLGDPPVEDDGHLVGASDVEVVADQALEERPARLGTVKDPGVGHLELAEGQLDRCSRDADRSG